MVQFTSEKRGPGPDLRPQIFLNQFFVYVAEASGSELKLTQASPGEGVRGRAQRLPRGAREASPHQRRH